MKTPSITTRHLLGGFLGSVSGILIAGYTKPYSPVLACLGLVLGTIAGYLLGHWWDELAKEWIGYIHQVRLVLRRFKRGRTAFVRRIVSMIDTWCIRWTSRFGAGLRSLSPFLYYVGKVVIFPFVLPVYMTRWCLGRPVRLLVTLKVLSWTVGVVCLFTLSYTLYPTADEVARIMAPAFPLFIVLCLSFIRFDSRKETCRAVRSYQSVGPVRYVGKEFGFFFLRCMGITAMIAVIVIFVACAVVMYVPVVLFGIFVGGVVWSLWKVTFRKGHLLGLTVTLCVTVTSAIINWDHLHGFSLWFIALGTGILSGLLAEGARRVSASVLPRIVGEKYITDDPIDTIVYVVKRMWARLHLRVLEDVFNSLGDKVGGPTIRFLFA